MKARILVLLIVLFIGCKQNSSSGFDDLDEDHKKVHIELERVSEILDKYETNIKALYKESEKNPYLVLDKTQKLIEEAIKEKDPDNIRWNKLGYLYDLRAEVLYKTGKYQESINELKKGILNDTTLLERPEEVGNALMASNLVKLNKHKEAKIYIERYGRGYYITDYLLGNYYETLNDIKTAKYYYTEVVKEKRLSHYFHYDYAKERLEELNKQNPKLLDELFYPTNLPDAKITKE